MTTIKVKPFKEIEDKVIFIQDNYGTINCPLCGFTIYKCNKYDGAYYNVIDLCIKDQDQEVTWLRYCLNCETLFSVSHKFEHGNCYTLEYVYIISEFKYEDKVILGTPFFDSYFSLTKEIQDKKLTSLTFTCQDNSSDPEAYYPESEYPEYYDKCHKSFIIENIIDIYLDCLELSLIPTRTKSVSFTKRSNNDV